MRSCLKQTDKQTKKKPPPISLPIMLPCLLCFLLFADTYTWTQAVAALLLWRLWLHQWLWHILFPQCHYWDGWVKMSLILYCVLCNNEWVLFIIIYYLYLMSWDTIYYTTSLNHNGNKGQVLMWIWGFKLIFICFKTIICSPSSLSLDIFNPHWHLFHYGTIFI